MHLSMPTAFMRLSAVRTPRSLDLFFNGALAQSPRIPEYAAAVPAPTRPVRGANQGTEIDRGWLLTAERTVLPLSRIENSFSALHTL